MALVALGAGVVIGWAGYKLYVYLFERNPPIQETIIPEQATSTTNIIPDEENNARDSVSRSLAMWAGKKILNKIADSIIVKLIKEFGAEVIEDLQQVRNRNETENGRPVRIAEGDVTSNSSSAASGQNRSRVELAEGGPPVIAADDDVTSSSGNSAVSRNFSSASSSIIRLRIIG